MSDRVEVGSIVRAKVMSNMKLIEIDAFLISRVESWKFGKFYVVQQRYHGDTEPREGAPTHQCSLDDVTLLSPARKHEVANG